MFEGVGFSLPPGGLLQVRGSNGSGKSSLLRMLCGLLPPERGTLSWRGRRLAAGDAAFAGEMAYLGHAPGASGDLSARENLRFSCRLAGADAAQCEDALQRVGLGRAAAQPVRRLSQGQRQRLALARVWAGQRPLWLLDEPGAALDAAGDDLLEDLLSVHLRAGGMAVVATHHALAASGAASRLALDMDALRPVRTQEPAC